jgi:hypothetical protein
LNDGSRSHPRRGGQQPLAAEARGTSLTGHGTTCRTTREHDATTRAHTVRHTHGAQRRTATTAALLSLATSSGGALVGCASSARPLLAAAAPPRRRRGRLSHIATRPWVCAASTAACRCFRRSTPDHPSTTPSAARSHKGQPGAVRRCLTARDERDECDAPGSAESGIDVDESGIDATPKVQRMDSSCDSLRRPRSVHLRAQRARRTRIGEAGQGSRRAWRCEAPSPQHWGRGPAAGGDASHAEATACARGDGAARVACGSARAASTSAMGRGSLKAKQQGGTEQAIVLGT